MRLATGGAEVVLRAIKRLEKHTTLTDAAELVFDAVGNFEPSYSDYVTEYLLSEVWLSGLEGSSYSRPSALTSIDALKDGPG